jgi:hypothetical protein
MVEKIDYKGLHNVAEGDTCIINGKKYSVIRNYHEVDMIYRGEGKADCPYSGHSIQLSDGKDDFRLFVGLKKEPMKLTKIAKCMNEDPLCGKAVSSELVVTAMVHLDLSSEIGKKRHEHIYPD